ncbi:MAG: beta-propeller domain-containing protein [Ruminococcus sp.]|jgi:uncharacterized secreted protein with C-terminal beta-propeller domain|nr:beta-propeller domain-containing protein [Ruminococcus sp.]
MTFDEKIIFAVDNIPVPDSLSPENIANMLKSTQKISTNKKSAHKTQKDVSENKPDITMSTSPVTKRNVIFKITAAVAACTVLVAGLLVYGNNTPEKPSLGEVITYEDIKPPAQMSSYSELYTIYSALAIESAGTKEFSNGITDYGVFSNGDSDIVKSDGKHIFCLSDGLLRIIDTETLSDICVITPSSQPPVELFVGEDTLYLISPGKERTVSLEVYDISDLKAPEKVSDFSQCGNYVSSRLENEKLIIVTDYSDYRTTPLEGDTDLEDFVPRYFIGQTENYVDPGNIIVPANAASTDYTVISAIDSDPKKGVEVKAILGSGGAAYCSDSELFIFGNEYLSGYSIISKFELGDLGYGGSVSLSGLIGGKASVSQYDDTLRVVTSSFDESGLLCTNIYVIDSKMNVINSAGTLLQGEILTDVRYGGNFIFLYTADAQKPALILDITAKPPVTVAVNALNDGKLTKYTESEMLKFSFSQNDSGNLTGLNLAMIDSVSGAMIAETSLSAENGIFFTDITNDARSLFIDSDKNIIGVPVYSFNEFGTQNRYYIYGFDTTEGFTLSTVIEYADIDDGNIFKRALITDDKLYIVGGERIVSVRLSDWKVIDSVTA